MSLNVEKCHPEGTALSWKPLVWLVGIFIGIALNLCINLGRTNIFVLSVLYKEMSFYLSLLLYLLKTFLKFSSYRFYTFLLKFICRYFVFFVAVISGHVNWTCKSCPVFIICGYESCWILCTFSTCYLFYSLSHSLKFSSILWYLKIEIVLILLYLFIYP